MAKTLQELRKENGYRTAKEFANAIGMSESSYGRYEADPENINMGAAIKLADFLGCSIDAVMGRDPINLADLRGEVQKFYDDLSEDSKNLFDEFRVFLQMRELSIKDKAKKEKQEKYFQIASNLESMMYSEGKNLDFGDGVSFFKELLNANPQKKRELFLKFIDDKFSTDRFNKAEEARFAEQDRLTSTVYKEFFKDKNTPIDNSEESHAAYDEVKRLAQIAFDEVFNPREKEDKEEIEKIMNAYDYLHPQPKGAAEYFIVNLED